MLVDKREGSCSSTLRAQSRLLELMKSVYLVIVRRMKEMVLKSNMSAMDNLSTVREDHESGMAEGTSIDAAGTKVGDQRKVP